MRNSTVLCRWSAALRSCFPCLFLHCFLRLLRARVSASSFHFGHQKLCQPTSSILRKNCDPVKLRFIGGIGKDQIPCGDLCFFPHHKGIRHILFRNQRTDISIPGDQKNMVIGIFHAVRQRILRPGIGKHFLLHFRNRFQILSLPCPGCSLMLPLCLRFSEVDGLHVISGDHPSFCRIIFPESRN